MATKTDIHQQITDRIIEAIEAGTKPWQCDWFKQQQLRANGQPYRGINCLLLAISTGRYGFTSPHWLTYRQAQELGGNVRQGERGTGIVFYKQLQRVEIADDGEETTRGGFVLKGYTVFNSEQIDGLPVGKFETAALPIVGAQARNEVAEEALRSCGATIRHGGEQAFYSPSADYVQMPPFERFYTADGYLATLSHELCHWTGHKSRLDRLTGSRFGSRPYAFEELIAEMGAAFVGARLGFAGEHLDNHAAYVAGWLKVLKNDKRAIFQAASAAQAAADLVLANVGAGEPVEAPAPAQMAMAI